MKFNNLYEKELLLKIYKIIYKKISKSFHTFSFNPNFFISIN